MGETTHVKAAALQEIQAMHQVTKAVKDDLHYSGISRYKRSAPGVARRRPRLRSRPARHRFAVQLGVPSPSSLAAAEAMRFPLRGSFLYSRPCVFHFFSF